MGDGIPTHPGGPFRNREIGEAYDDMRAACARLERLLGGNSHGLKPKDLKRADKAVTVMKVGFKLLKKAGRRTAPEVVMRPGNVADFRRTSADASRAMVQQIQDRARRL